MTAKDIISPRRKADEVLGLRSISATTPVLDVLPRLLDTTERMLAVEEEGMVIGVIDERSLLEGLGSTIAPRYDTSTVIVESAPEDYSPSLMTHAAEDVDAPVVDLFTAPTYNNSIRTTMRVRTEDPSRVVRNLERYNFRVADAFGPYNSDAEIASRNLAALNMYLNV